MQENEEANWDTRRPSTFVIVTSAAFELSVASRIEPTLLFWALIWRSPVIVMMMAQSHLTMTMMTAQ
jgi:hypothetical protein